MKSILGFMVKCELCTVAECAGWGCKVSSELRGTFVSRLKPGCLAGFKKYTC